MRLIAGLARLDSGAIRIDGIDAAARPVEARRRLSYLPQKPSFPSTLSVREVVAVAAKLRGVPAAVVDRELDLCGLTALADRPVGRLSGGERQRVGLAVTFAADVPLYLFDETSTSLDPAATALVATRARALCAEGRTVLLTTHTAADVAGVATRIGILRAGRIEEVDRVAFGNALRLANEAQRTLRALVGEKESYAPDPMAGPADPRAARSGGLWAWLGPASARAAGSR
jgi:ABC-2 type transport system ATP-binding protein